MIRVQTEDFDIGAEISRMTAGNTEIGGLASFVGLVRDYAGNEKISSMTLEHYPGMTEAALEEIEAEARDRWPLSAVLIIHRVGRLMPGENIMMVAAAARHRKAAFEAAEFLMDYLKTRAPFWKKEETAEGARWVDAREADDEAAAKWAR